MLPASRQRNENRMGIAANAAYGSRTSGQTDPALPSSRRPLRPEDDAFFQAPTGFERLVEGTVLRSRRVHLALFGVVPQKFSAWQLLYRTCDLDGAAQAGVTTVLLPE